ncbi:hypothetical protein M9H77_08778 [Catharanthus roseus]|uniref:Uncharacterized protein n=1 Tax=Catharanthus roseus TaxID=4058 RepID=A0ACC0BYP9_CATRO|nr:hypothetical protein M9H77_08778 [Catharanthus roseus]
MPNDLQLMSIISGGLSCGQLYGAGLEAVHLRAKSSRAAAGLPSCYLEAEQRILSWVETVVSSVCTAFDEHNKQSHLLYTPMPLMMDIIKVAMAVVPSTSSSKAVAAGTSYAREVSGLFYKL